MFLKCNIPNCVVGLYFFYSNQGNLSNEYLSFEKMCGRIPGLLGMPMSKISECFAMDGLSYGCKK